MALVKKSSSVCKNVLHDEQVNKIVAADESLLTFYPKIKGVPDEKRKQA